MSTVARTTQVTQAAPAPRQRQTRVDTHTSEAELNWLPGTHTHWGDELTSNEKGEYFRLLFHNVNGVSRNPDHSSDRQREILQGAKSEIQASIFSFVECNVDWNMQRCRLIWQSTLQGLWPYSTYVTSSVPTVEDGESVYLPGGTCTTIVDKWATRVLEKGADALLGRFSWVTMAGKQNKKVTFVTVYRVGKDNSGTDAIRITARVTARAQQIRMMRVQGNITDPREQTIEDVIRTVGEFQAKGHSIVLSWDANEQRSHDAQTSGVNRVLNECGLVDAHSFTHPTLTAPATHCNVSVQIDFVFVSSDFLPSIRATSILALHHGYTSDPRALIVDFDPKILFGSNTSDIEKQTRRELISTNPRAMEKYIRSTRKAFQSNTIEARVHRHDKPWMTQSKPLRRTSWNTTLSTDKSRTSC
jgi:hypothetical protein